MTEQRDTNTMPADPVPVICIAGATGTGKTAAAIALARDLGGEVINMDSRQIYKDFPVITAQPSLEEQKACPHHLYGFLPAEEKMAAGVWAELAAGKAREVLARGRVPLLVGGTGLYFKILLHGIAGIPQIDPAITADLLERCGKEGSPRLHAELADADPAYAAKIHPNDRQRIVRALEVIRGTGRPFSWWHSHAATAPLCTGPLFGLHISLEELTPRLDRRIDAMLEQGALDEARQARSRCPDTSAPGWSGIGCAELAAYFSGHLSLAEARTLWLKNTRAYAKRQITWFKAQPELRWFAPDARTELAEAAQSFLSRS